MGCGHIRDDGVSQFFLELIEAEDQEIDDDYGKPKDGVLPEQKCDSTEESLHGIWKAYRTIRTDKEN